MLSVRFSLVDYLLDIILYALVILHTADYPQLRLVFSSSNILLCLKISFVCLTAGTPKKNATGEWYALSAGGSFTPHVIIVGTGEVRHRFDLNLVTISSWPAN
jgi:hypothetical protein